MVNLRSMPFFTFSQILVPALAILGLAVITSATWPTSLKKWRLTRPMISPARSKRCGWQVVGAGAVRKLLPPAEANWGGGVVCESFCETATLSKVGALARKVSVDVKLPPHATSAATVAQGTRRVSFIFDSS